MIKKIVVILLTLVAVLCLLPAGTLAAYTPPSAYGAPEYFTATNYSTREDWDGITATVNAPADLRAFLDQVAAPDSAFNTSGFTVTDIMLQLDYKAEGGSWHYTADWDNHLDWMANMSTIRLSSGVYSTSCTFTKGMFEGFAPGETFPEKNSYFDSHTMDLKTRFIISTKDSDGNNYYAKSPWSSVYTYSSKKAPTADPAALLNHAPVLKSVQVKKDEYGKPYLHVVTDTAPAEVTLLNSLSSGNVTSELWIKVGNGDWVTTGLSNFVEQYDIQAAEVYFGFKDNYDAVVFDAKVRYCFDLSHYPGTSETSQTIYSPYSNIISVRQAAYSNASGWAKPELDKASTYGLIPASLIGADMTRPITREEFAELAVVLYEKTTGKTAQAASPNPFTDTTNPEILKAFQLKITTGITETKFAPSDLTNREQVATMLSRAIRVMVPGGDFSTAGAPTFSDAADIDSWALEHVLFMAKIGIVNGSGGKFMPKAVTTAQAASGYATTTCEQALAMSTRIFEKYK